MPVRKPSVAGTFYPSESAEIQKFCKSRLQASAPPIRARALILPHAGYIYSGETACRVLSQVEIPKTNFLIGPNHRGFGHDFALFAQGMWETPLGTVPIKEPLAKALLKKCPFIQEDIQAHGLEHSLEVLVPLLQSKNLQLEIVPLLVGGFDLNRAKEVALQSAELMNADPDILLVISTDMSHYDTDDVTRKKDKYALDAIQNLDEKALMNAFQEHHVTMCGLIPVYMLLCMKGIIPFKKVSLVDYRTSADASGDKTRVVGYAGFIFE